MLLDQPVFLLFLGFSLVAFRLTPVALRWRTLLVLSLLFYLSFSAPALLLALIAEAGIAWAAARGAQRAGDGPARVRWLVGGAAALVAVLVCVRIAGSPGALPAWWPAGGRLATSLGVSYFTLQAVSYVADVSLGRIRAEPSFGKVLTYLALFPKLIQGPIERAGSLLPQLDAPRIPGYEGLRSAALLFGWGLFKTAVLGERLARIVDPAFARPEDFGGLAPVLAAYAFAFQLYFDFSGYTDMARGTARVLGIELTENFRAPYLASSISDFWRRWHITFSRWLLDYVFAPLHAAWRRAPILGTAGALLVTFGLSGLWHGFAWHYLVWGFLHGSGLAVESVARRLRRGAARGTPGGRLAGVLVTFHLVVLAWVFFRAPSVGAAMAVLASVLQPAGGTARLVDAAGGWLPVGLTLAACGGYALVSWGRKLRVFDTLARHAPVRWAFYYGLVVAILLLRQDGAGFLYSQF
jgi:alginate O-acetyltransferase complex protein AlgI